MAGKRFVPINTKISLIIILTLVLGIGGVSFFFYEHVSSMITESTEQNFEQKSTILFSAIENFMLPGDAEQAVSFFENLGTSRRELSVRLFRRDGTPAFSDLTTIDDVVERAPGLAQTFANPTDRLSAEGEVDRDSFAQSVSMPPKTVFFREVENNQVVARAYMPLINLPKCTDCHGSDHTIRGVIDLRTDITESAMRQRESALISGSLFVGMVFVLTIILTLFMRRSVIRPVQTIGEVCRGVTEGNFDRRVSLKKRDEIGTLGETVNTMVEGLHERFELQKFVSSQTLESLLGEREGKNVMLTLFFSDIRGFTEYTERNAPDHVVQHLNEILNVQTEIIHEHGGDIDKYVGDEIVAMFSGDNQAKCAVDAALAIQREIGRASAEKHDGLTVGIGINTGDVILGMIGSERRADYTIIGDNVNTASRLCGAAEPGGIIIAESTYNQTGKTLQVEGPMRLKAKGKAEYLRVYKVPSAPGEEAQ